MSSREIKLPWPPKELSPNARGHWSKKSKAAKKYRADCYRLTRSHIARHGALDLDGELHLFLDFYPPDKRRRDDDNMIAAFKSGRDGLAEAMGIDDVRFRTHPFVKDETGGFVAVRVTNRCEA